VWAAVPKTPFCDWLVEAACREVGFENVFILTRPTRHGDCYAGKADWVINNLGEPFVEQLIPTKHKCKLAREWTLLIDDSFRNVDAFLASGGKTIMCPRPWNALSHEDPAQYIAYSWTHYFNEPIEAPVPEDENAVEATE
jgi:5'(3')-deoxyribonucleotidase